MKAAVFVTIGLMLVSPASAQVTRQQPTTLGPSALQSHAARIEQDAAQDLKRDPKGAAWFVDLDVFIPNDKAEYQALGRYVVLVLAAFNRNKTELPLAAVFSGGSPLKCLAPVGREVPPTSATAKAYGGFRSDTLCLLPADLARRSNSITVDFARNRKGLQISSYPIGQSDLIKSDNDASPPGAPNPPVLEKIINREYPGFGFRVTP